MESEEDEEPSLGSAGRTGDDFAGTADKTPLISPVKPMVENKSDNKSMTVEQAMDHIGFGPFTTRMMIWTGLMWGTEGMEMMLLSFLVPKLEDAWNLSGFEQGLISSSVFLGSLLGTFTFALIADRIGRRKVLIFTTLGCALFGTLTALSPGLWTMLILRFCLGACIGAGETASVLAAELSPSKHRGTLLIAMATFWSIGALLSSFLAWISFTLLDWRWYLIFNAMPCWIVWLGSFTLPESPRFLFAQNLADESRSVLEQIAEENGSLMMIEGITLVASEVDINNNNNTLDDGDDHLSKKEDLLWDVFRWDAFGYTSPLLFLLFNIVVGTYYGLAFISEHFFAHAHGLSLYAQMTIATSSELPGLLIGFLYLDYIGRRETMFVCFLMFSICTILATLPLAQNQVYFGLIFMYLARLSVNLGFTVAYVYFNEYYPTTIRTTALGSASASARLSAVATSFIATECPLNAALIIYAVFSGLGALCCYLLPFDTNGITMVDTIDEAKTRNEIESRKAKYETSSVTDD